MPSLSETVRPLVSMKVVSSAGPPFRHTAVFTQILPNTPGIERTTTETGLDSHAELDSLLPQVSPAAGCLDSVTVPHS